MSDYFRVNYGSSTLPTKEVAIDARSNNPLKCDSLGLLREYYASQIHQELVDINHLTVTIRGLGKVTSLYLQQETIPVEGEEPYNVNWIEVQDDLYGRHLRAILGLFVKDEDEKGPYKIFIPNHFEAFGGDNKLLLEDNVLECLNDESKLDRRRSSMLIVMGKSFDENLKDSQQIWGLTQMKVDFHPNK